MTTYNGYKNWNTWNVSLWVNNDEYFYRYALDLVKRYGESRAAAKLYKEYKGQRTPDGARYTLIGFKAALVGMEE